MINRGDLGSYGTMFEIVFETTKTYTNRRVCFEIEGISDERVTPQGIFPDLKEYNVSTNVQLSVAVCILTSLECW